MEVLVVVLLEVLEVYEVVDVALHSLHVESYRKYSAVPLDVPAPIRALGDPVECESSLWVAILHSSVVWMLPSLK